MTRKPTPSAVPRSVRPTDRYRKPLINLNRAPSLMEELAKGWAR